MKSLADQLPPEIASQIHPDWRKNEADYWAVRDQLLGQYRDQWIGFADGKVIAAFGVPTIPVVGLAKRQSFLVKDGRIVWYSPNAQTSTHAKEVWKRSSWN